MGEGAPVLDMPEDGVPRGGRPQSRRDAATVPGVRRGDDERRDHERLFDGRRAGITRSWATQRRRPGSVNRQWPAAATPRRTRLDVSPTTAHVKRLPGSVPRISENAFGDDSPVWVVATVRSELLSTAPERAGLAEVVDDSLVIEPLSRARLPIVIQQPAQRRLAVRAWAGGADSGVDDWVRPIPLVAFMPTVRVERDADRRRSRPTRRVCRRRPPPHRRPEADDDLEGGGLRSLSGVAVPLVVGSSPVSPAAIPPRAPGRAAQRGCVPRRRAPRTACAPPRAARHATGRRGGLAAR